MFRGKIRREIEKLVPIGAAFSIERPENLKHGDYSSNVALVLAKESKKNPREVAEELKQKLQKPLSKFIEKIEIAGPGFLNFWISRSALTAGLRGILENPDGWGKSDIGKGKTILVEYFQLNVGKPSHVGHLRSAVIGDALKRILSAQGYKTVSDTHIGDWGTQFGILIQAFKRHKNELTEKQLSKSYIITADAMKEFERLYREENEFIDKNPELRESAKKEFAKLEKGDPENKLIWHWFVAGTKSELQRAINRLSLQISYEEIGMGESFYEDKTQPIVKDALAKGIAKNKDGAIIVDLGEYNLDEAVLVKSDGASTYLLRDLATIKYRKEKWKFDNNLYVVDVRQTHHFKQVFKVAELLKFDGVEESQHISYGFMSLPEGAISTRKGTTISLESVLDEAENRARMIIKEKNPELESADEVARQVGIGAIKYFDLSHNRHSDIVFKWDEALSFDGNSGPYLQYTHARLKSILRKLGKVATKKIENIELDSTEQNLLVSILYFPEIIEDALADFMPNILANYLFELAKLANNFYHSHPIIQEENKEKQKFRAALAIAASSTIKNGLNLLGIDAPEKM